MKHDITEKHDTSRRKKMENIVKLDYVLKPILSGQTHTDTYKVRLKYARKFRKIWTQKLKRNLPEQ